MTMEEQKKQENIDVNGLISQNRVLYEQLMEARRILAYKRLDYLFKVMEYRAAFDSDFLIKCIEEIQETIMPKEKEEDTEEDTEK